MSALAALAGALLASLWQVLLPALAYAALRPALSGAGPRYLGALATLAVQVAWPVSTFLRLLEAPAHLPGPAGAPAGWWWLALPVAWAAGATAMLARLLGGLVLVRRWVRSASRLEAGLERRLRALAEALGVTRVAFGLAGHLDVPVAVGFWRPVVLLPASVLTALPVASLELLVAHELVHVRRWDALANAAQLLAEALLFFHPALWWVSAAAREEREYRCDDEVVRHLGGAARPYAEALLALEQSRHPAAALAVASTGGAFVKRIRRLLARSPSRAVVPLLPALLALMGCGAAVAVAVRSPPAPVPVSAELRPVLQGLCQHVRTDPCRPEVVAAGVPAADLLTIVLADLGEQQPAFQRFLGEVGQVPPDQRRAAIARGASEAVGAPWTCPEFDALWESRPVDWCGR